MRIVKPERIIEILSEWNFWYNTLETGTIRQGYIDNIKRKSETGEIVVVSGIRRCGKSVLLRQFAKSLLTDGVEKERILIVNFEDYRWESYSLAILENIWNTYLERINPKEPPFLFLDEIHLVPGWERFVRTLHEKKDARIVVSGSSSKLLSTEYATLLSGRFLEVRVYPLSFREFLNFRNVMFSTDTEMTARKREILKLLNEYLLLGGFPMPVLTHEPELLKSYFETIIIKDVAERFGIRDVEKLKRLAVFYLTNISNTITYNSIARFTGIPLHTVERYSSYLEEALMLNFVSVFSYSLKVQNRSPRKVYATDTGLGNAVGYRFSENTGRLMENVVFLELKRRYPETYYSKTDKGELDFVVKAGLNVVKLFQVTDASSENDIDKRELKRLAEASEGYKCTDQNIITWDFEGMLGEIKCVPLWKWLLDNR